MEGGSGVVAIILLLLFPPFVYGYIWGKSLFRKSEGSSGRDRRCRREDSCGCCKLHVCFVFLICGGCCSYAVCVSDNSELPALK